MFSIKTLLVAAAFSAVAVGASAQEIPLHVGADVAVTYGDLDLEDARGARAMLRRLDRASRHACGGSPNISPFPGVTGLEVRAEFNACRASALSDAVGRLGAPLVTQAYQDSRPAPMTRLAGRR